MLIIISLIGIAVIFYYLYSEQEGFQLLTLFYTMIMSCVLYGMLFLFLCMLGVCEPGIIPKVYRSKFLEINYKIKDKINEIW